MKMINFAIVLLFSTYGYATNHGHEVKSVSPETAINWLKNGNLRFKTGNFRADGRSQKDVKKVISSQHPHTIVLSCSDSRVPPELIFDQGIGEIFTVRVAGEALDSSVIASVEYAVEHLGSQLIVVLGHTSCGAVKAAISTAEGKSAGSASLDSLVADIKPRLPEKSSAEGNVEKESTSNARLVAADLSKRSKIIEEHIANGKLKIISALYHLENGKVSWLDK